MILVSAAYLFLCDMSINSLNDDFEDDEDFVESEDEVDLIQVNTHDVSNSAVIDDSLIDFDDPV